MGQRMFVAFRPPADVSEELSGFLEARPQMPWINPEQWHVTLAFMESVPEHSYDELVERLTDGFARKSAPHVALQGAGCFPDPTRAKVLWTALTEFQGSLADLAVTARLGAAKAGAPVDGRAFTAHLTLARLRRPVEATRWLRILDTFVSNPWRVGRVELIASFLREGPAARPRHEVVAEFPLLADAQR